MVRKRHGFHWDGEGTWREMARPLRQDLDAIRGLLLLMVGSKIFPDERQGDGEEVLWFPVPSRMVEEACLPDIKRPFATITTKLEIGLATCDSHCRRGLF
jgi:hypothetical protein